MEIKSFGIYNLKKEYLEDRYPSFFPGKKGRPFALIFQDKANPDILWALPISKSQKYENILKKYPNNIVKYKMPKFNSYILTQNIIPLYKSDIANEYRVNDVHVTIKSPLKQKEILAKSNRFLFLIKNSFVQYHNVVKELYEELSEEIELKNEEHDLIKNEIMKF